MSSSLPTQMIIFPVKPDATIENPSTKDGQIWSQVLDILEGWNGFRRLYWGRRVEEREKTHIHIVRDSMHQHFTFLSSAQWANLGMVIAPICTSSPESFVVRHAHIENFTPNPAALGKGAPFTGTAIYLTSTPKDWEKAWALWTTIVSRVEGCMGVTGGWMVEPVEGYETCYTVWVGWESLEVHDKYHHDKNFWKKRIVLQLHNEG
ncbi:hypothetical protein HFD88_008538 [Aspergillus terreus]|nr:hypothetical protein HFD88_008538 [Aspergillus terreus]